MSKVRTRQDGSPDPVVFSVDVFCARNDLSRAYFYRLVNSGVIPIVKAGRRTQVTAAGEKLYHERLEAGLLR